MDISTRRSFLKSLGGVALAPFFSFSSVSLFAASPSASLLTKKIPASGESIPVIGMGSWLTFDVGDSEIDRTRCIKILETFFEHGGGMIDSSPMYGSSQEVIGYCLNKFPQQASLFSATKVWIIGKSLGITQMNNSYSYWGLPKFDLKQIHNMLNWRTHLETLKEWKQQGRIRYIGITTSHGRRHKKLEKALLEEEFDFVQFTYNVIDREVEQRLLPVAKERGIAVIINRPFQRGSLFDLVNNKPLPDFATEIGCQNWAQFFLKFIVSHPVVTCAIPATSQVVHMQENMSAGYGQLPDEAMRKRMIRYVEKII